MKMRRKIFLLLAVGVAMLGWLAWQFKDSRLPYESSQSAALQSATTSSGEVKIPHAEITERNAVMPSLTNDESQNVGEPMDPDASHSGVDNIDQTEPKNIGDEPLDADSLQPTTQTDGPPQNIGPRLDSDVPPEQLEGLDEARAPQNIGDALDADADVSIQESPDSSPLQNIGPPAAGAGS